MSRQSASFIAAFAAILLLPGVATATPTAADAEATAQADDATVSTTADANEAEEESGAWPFSMTAMYTTTVGQGTFVSNDFAKNPYVAWTLSLIPAYTFPDGTNVSAWLDLSQELTDSDGDTHPRQLLLSDLFITASRSIWTIPLAEIAISGLARVYTPTSLASQHQGLYVGLYGGLVFSRTFGPVTISYRGTFRKNFHEYTNPTASTKGGNEEVFLAREGGNEKVGAFQVALGGNNISYGITNRLLVSYAPIDSLALTASYLLANSWTYNSFPKDEFSGEPAKAGRGQRDAFAANVDATWTFYDPFSVSLGLVNQGTPKSADNKHFVFPFFDLESEANNLTTFYLAFSATFNGDEFGL